MNHTDKKQTKWIAVVCTILFFAAAFIVAMLMYGLGSVSWNNWRVILNVGLLFAVLGAFYGTIVSLDSASDMSTIDRPVLRTFLCGVLGASAVLLVQAWPPQSFSALGAIDGLVAGAFLGWLGWSWARYVDF